MSRIGKIPVTVPAGVDFQVSDMNVVTVTGPKGKLCQKLHPDILIDEQDNVIRVSRPSDHKRHRELHGLTRTLVANMVEGVTKGFQKVLEVNGVGYRAAKQGNKLVLTLGYSHPVEIQEIPGITFEVPHQNQIIVKGHDKQLVGEIAAGIRKTRPPEPYKGKGIKYDYEFIHRKEGKASAKKK